MLLLHGEEGQNITTRERAYWFSQQGYVAFAPDYFTPFGIIPGKFKTSFYQDDVDRVRETLAWCILGLKAPPYVSKERIGVYGHSLGGYLSFILGTRSDVKAVISCSGAYAPAVPSRYTLDEVCTQIYGPVLIFHGEADDVVPISDASTAADLLKKYNKQYEYITYPGTGHYFDVKQMESYSEKTTADYQQKMLAFLKAKMP